MRPARETRTGEPHLGLIVSIAKRFTVRAERAGLDFEDLLQEGRIGLARAEESYDPSRGTFATYASYWIRCKIRLAIVNAGSIRVPAHMHAKGLADKSLIRIGSLDAPISEDTALIEVLTSDAKNPEEDYIREDMVCRVKNDMARALSCLRPAERQVIQGMTEERPTRDIAVSMGRSHQRVYQISRLAVGKLVKILSTSQAVRDCLDSTG